MRTIKVRLLQRATWNDRVEHPASRLSAPLLRTSRNVRSTWAWPGSMRPNSMISPAPSPQWPRNRRLESGDRGPRPIVSVRERIRPGLGTPDNEPETDLEHQGCAGRRGETQAECYPLRVTSGSHLSPHARHIFISSGDRTTGVFEESLEGSELQLHVSIQHRRNS
jgi:hypothetical protein